MMRSGEKDVKELGPEEARAAAQLHEQALVVNMYGGPFSGPRPLRDWRAGTLRDSGEWVAPVQDAVANFLVPEMVAGGVNCVVATIATFDDLALWLREFETSAEAAVLAVTAADARRAQAAGRCAFFLCGSGTISDNIGRALDAILLFRRGGVRLWSLTHSARNLISDGCGEASNCGLSRFGQHFVQELNRRQIVIDVSHISDAGFWDVMALSTAPVIASHSNCRALCEHERNLSDEMIRALADSGGMVGLNFFPLFVREHGATVEDIVDHVDHISALVGPEFVGLGPDFCAGRWRYVLQSWWRFGSSDHNAQRTSLEYPAGAEDTTQMVNVTRALAARGYTDGEIRGILGENFLRVFDSVMQPAPAAPTG